ncbi:MAG: hypothetical protein ACOH5I_18450 [Oligoflexus sp.]
MSTNVKQPMKQLVSLGFLALLLGTACGDGGKDGGDNGEHYGPDGMMGAPTNIQADLSRAVGLLAIETGSGLRLQDTEGEKSEESESGELLKVDENGDVSNVLSMDNAGGWTMPPVKTMALGPDGKIYLHFNHPFWMHDPNGGEGYSCNLFYVDGGTYDQLAAGNGGPQNLVCLDRENHVGDWNSARESAFQFDGAGNIYYAGWSQADGRSQLIMRRPDGTTEIKINKNIWFQDYFITESGGVFYTGQSEDSNNGGFFRYISPDAGLQQISDGFWGFKFEPGQTEEGDIAIFYGPDPREEVSNNNHWQTACLFRYDASLYDIDAENPILNAVESVIGCSSGDSWEYFQLLSAKDRDTYGDGYGWATNTSSQPTNAWLAEFENRCKATGDTFLGGGEIQKIHQTKEGEIYIIGYLNVKSEAGTVKCSLEVGGGGNICLKDGAPIFATDTTDCSASGGVWQANNSIAYYDYVTDAELCGVGSDTKDAQGYTDIGTGGNYYVKLTRSDCYNGSNANDYWNMFSNYTGVAKVDKVNKTLSALTDNTAEAVKFWFIDDAAYYVTKKSGVYRLNKMVEGSEPQVLLTNFEVYHLASSGREGTILFSGLDFSTNQVVFGDLDVSSGVLDENEQIGEAKVGAILSFDAE